MHLLDRGHDVTGVHFHMRSKRVKTGLQEFLLDVGSFSDVERLLNQVPPCDAVVHAAASLDMNLFNSSVPHTNCGGVQNMLWLASHWGSRFVFLSSLPVIGTPQMLPIAETHPVLPLTGYHASKLFGEQLIRLAQMQGLMGVSLRLTAPVGPGMPRGRLLPVLVARALQQVPLVLSGAGTRRQNYIDVRDVAAAVELCLDRSAVGLFNIASACTISNVALAQRCIERCQSSSQIKFTGEKDPEDGLTWDVSIDKARRELGFLPRFDIDDAISAVLADIERSQA